MLAAAQGQNTDATMSGMMINAKESLRIAIARSGDIGQKAWDAVEGLKGRFIKHDLNILGYRKYFLTVSAVLVVLCFVVLGVRGLNFGIEFVGGTYFAHVVLRRFDIPYSEIKLNHKNIKQKAL